jgi:hypothetical protein
MNVHTYFSLIAYVVCFCECSLGQLQLKKWWLIPQLPYLVAYKIIIVFIIYFQDESESQSKRWPASTPRPASSPMHPTSREVRTYEMLPSSIVHVYPWFHQWRLSRTAAHLF